jgi:hypothetical protein
MRDALARAQGAAPSEDAVHGAWAEVEGWLRGQGAEPAELAAARDRLEIHRDDAARLELPEQLLDDNWRRALGQVQMSLAKIAGAVLNGVQRDSQPM